MGTSKPYFVSITDRNKYLSGIQAFLYIHTISIIKMAFRFQVAVAILTLVVGVVYASDPSPLQDFCVAVADAKAAGKISRCC